MGRFFQKNLSSNSHCLERAQLQQSFPVGNGTGPYSVLRFRLRGVRPVMEYCYIGGDSFLLSFRRITFPFTPDQLTSFLLVTPEGKRGGGKKGGGTSAGGMQDSRVLDRSILSLG